MIRLSREGVFPTEKCSKSDKYSTGFSVAGTIQGEGKWAGMPSLFVRLQGCNLRCVWHGSQGKLFPCDTAHAQAVDATAQAASAEDIFEVLKNSAGAKIRHIVITGGEPLLQAKELLPLMELLRKNGFVTTIETNGTIFSPQAKKCIELCNLLSISPKTSSALQTTPDIAPLKKLVRAAESASVEYQLKFVVAAMSDEDEIRSTIEEVGGVRAEDVLLMPAGTSPEDMQTNGCVAAEMAVKNGWRFATRQHVLLWGNRSSV